MISAFRRIFRLDKGSTDVVAEVDDELRFHFENTMSELKASGLSDADARAEAERRFGNLALTRERLIGIDESREDRARWRDRAGSLGQDLRHSLRSLAREPGFTFTVAITLALGIGANATMVGLVDRVMFRPPAHVVDADRLVRLSMTETNPRFGTWTNTGLAWPDYILSREQNVFASSAGYTDGTLTMGRGADARPVRASLVTANYFPTLGVQPFLGRFFSAEEDRVGGGPAVVVLGHRFWRTRFAARTNVLGESFRVGSQIFTVIGVTPEGFGGVDLSAAEIFLPIGSGGREFMGRDTEWETTRNWQWIRVIARLAPGVTPEAAATQLTASYRIAVVSDPDPNHDRQTNTFGTHPIAIGRSPDGPESARVTEWLAVVSILVLLIACSNVANLLLARGARRQREISVRLALGVRRRRLLGQLLLESAVLAVLGGALALLVVRWGGYAMRTFLLPDIDWVDDPLDLRTATFAAIATLLTVLLAGLTPALTASRGELSDVLRSSAQGAGTAKRHHRFRRGLLLAQTALSMVLLVGAGLFVRSLRNVLNLDLGFERRGLITAALELEPFMYPPEARMRMYDRAREDLATLPGVLGVSLGIPVPFGTSYSTEVRLPGRDSVPRLRTAGPYYSGVTPDYFATMGISVIKGRGFTEADRKGTAPVMIVNGTMARTYWPGEEAIGKCVMLGSDSVPPCAEVVGIVEDARRMQLREEPMLQYYVPVDQSRSFGMSTDRTLFIRVAGDPERMIEPIRRTLMALDANLPWAAVRSMDTTLQPRIQPWRLGAMVLSVFGALALVVAAVGLFGVLAYSVATRTHEFGVRGALGADRGRLVGLVLREALIITAIGLAIGAVGALVLGRWTAPLLFETSPSDPAIIGGVAIVMLIVAVGASLIPGLRAARVDPATALRAD
jgi:putative ABC transport system permease protein